MTDQPTTAPTKHQADIIRHSLGYDYPDKIRRNRGPYRNYYCAGNGSIALEAMVAQGWMNRGSVINDGKDRYYHVTDAGAAAAGVAMPQDF
jgi:hypothetical protein